MTNPLEGVTDAHLQAALDEFRYGEYTPADIRVDHHSWAAVIAHARQIAATEKLTAELAELRAKYEPEPVDPVAAEVEAILANWGPNPAPITEFGAACIRRGMEMQPAPFTRDEAEWVAGVMYPRGGSKWQVAIRALTTPPAELRAMLGEAK